MGGFWGNRRSSMLGKRMIASDTRRGGRGQGSDKRTDHESLGVRGTRNFSLILLLACKRRISWLRNSILRRMTDTPPTLVKPRWRNGTSTRNLRLDSSIAFRPPIPSARRSRRPQNMMATARSRRYGTGGVDFSVGDLERLANGQVVRSRRKCLAAKREFKTRHADHVGRRFGGGRRDGSLVCDEMMRLPRVAPRTQASRVLAVKLSNAAAVRSRRRARVSRLPAGGHSDLRAGASARRS